MLTMSFSMTPRLAVVSTGLGVPKSTSENSVPHMDPPQPSDRPARRDWRIRASGREEQRSEEHTSELQSRFDLVCRLLLEKKKLAAYLQTVLHSLSRDPMLQDA